MACNRWNDQWVARLYGELDADEDRRATEHLAACADCRETLRGLADTRRVLLETTPAVPPAPRLVMLRPTGLRRPAWAFAAGLAAAAALFAVMLYTVPLPGVPSGGAGPEVAALEARLAALEQQGPVPASGVVTEDQLAAELAKLVRGIDAARLRDAEYLLSEIQALELRNRRQINDNNDAILRAAFDRKGSLSQY